MYSYDDIFLFVKTVEVGSFINTAKLLKISQSTVSKRIKDLELAINITLIRRNTKNFEITDAGNAIYNYFKDKIKEFDQAMIKFTDKKPDPQGTLNVLLPPAMAFGLITPALPQFLLKYPKINLNICYQNTEIDLIKEGFDIAILNHVPKQQSQKIKNIFSADVRLYCSKTYAEKYGLPNFPEEMANHLIAGHMLDDHTIPSHLPLTNIKTGETTVVNMPKRITTNNSLHNIQLLKTNEVIVALLDNVVLNINDELIQVLPEYSLFNMKFYLLRHPHNNDVSSQVFCEFLEERLKI